MPFDLDDDDEDKLPPNTTTTATTATASNTDDSSDDGNGFDGAGSTKRPRLDISVVPTCCGSQQDGAVYRVCGLT